jgi:hypothetical protein
MCHVRYEILCDGVSDANCASTLSGFHYCRSRHSLALVSVIATSSSSRNDFYDDGSGGGDASHKSQCSFSCSLVALISIEQAPKHSPAVPECMAVAVRLCSAPVSGLVVVESMAVAQAVVEIVVAQNC